MNEIQVAAPQAVEPASQALAMISAAATDPNVDPSKLERMFDLYIRVRDDQARVQFQADLAALQALLPPIEKDGAIMVGREPRSRYATAERIDAVIKPLLAEYGFSLAFDSESSERGIRISGKLMHKAGHHETKTVEFPLDTSGGKPGPQAAASTIAYGKRHLIKMHLNIVEKGEDKDGQGSDPISAKQADTIRDLILAGDGVIQEKAFLAWLKVARVEDIPAKRFDEAVAALKRALAKAKEAK